MRGSVAIVLLLGCGGAPAGPRSRPIEPDAGTQPSVEVDAGAAEAVPMVRDMHLGPECTVWDDGFVTQGGLIVRELGAAQSVACGTEWICSLGPSGGVRCIVARGISAPGIDRWYHCGIDERYASGVRAIEGASLRTCLLLDSGQVHCWGSSHPFGDDRQESCPMEVASVAGATQLYDNGAIACAWNETAPPTCWGSHGGLVRDRFAPRVMTELGVVRDLSLWESHVWFVTSGGEVRHGWMSAGGWTRVHEPGRVLPSARAVAFASANPVEGGDPDGVVCILAEDSSVHCGITGTASTSLAPRLTPISGLTDIAELESGPGRFCARTRAGEIRCWDAEEHSPSRVSASEPRRVPGLPPLVWIAVAAGAPFSCGLDASGAAYCWGRAPMLADEFVLSPEPFPMPPAGRIWLQHAGLCAELESGGIACMSTRHPLEPVSLPGPVRDIAFGGDGLRCALLEEASVHCWFDNPRRGEPGRPIPMRGLRADTIASGISIVASGTRRTSIEPRGSSLEGPPRTIRTRPAGPLRPPVRVDEPTSELGPWRQLASSRHHTCALTEDGAAYCWGSGRAGALGLGPVEVQPQRVVREEH